MRAAARLSDGLGAQMPIDDTRLRQLATLTRIDVDGSCELSADALRQRLNEHLAWIDGAWNPEDDALPPLTHVGDPQTWLRDDVPESTLGTDVALRNAPMHDEDFFLVPQVVDDNS